MKVRVELLSTEPSAVAAVRSTIETLPMGGQLLEECGEFYIVGPHFVVWAAQRQGYVKKVLWETLVPDEQERRAATALAGEVLDRIEQRRWRDPPKG